MKKDRETAPQKYDTQRRAERFSVSGEGGRLGGREGINNVEILRPIHQLRRSQKVTLATSGNQSQIWSERGRKPGSGGSAQVGISIHVQGSAGSVTFSTMMKTHWCGWERMSRTSSAVVTGRCRTNKNKKSKVWRITGSLDAAVQYWICINGFSSPFRAKLRQKLITVHMPNICISSCVPFCFHSMVGGSLTGLNQIGRALAPPPHPTPPLLPSGCPIPLFITSFCGCFE